MDDFATDVSVQFCLVQYVFRIATSWIEWTVHQNFISLVLFASNRIQWRSHERTKNEKKAFTTRSENWSIFQNEAMGIVN